MIWSIQIRNHVKSIYSINNPALVCWKGKVHVNYKIVHPWLPSFEEILHSAPCLQNCSKHKRGTVTQVEALESPLLSIQNFAERFWTHWPELQGTSIFLPWFQGCHAMEPMEAAIELTMEAASRYQGAFEVGEAVAVGSFETFLTKHESYTSHSLW